jgi:hypothetical protein
MTLKHRGRAPYLSAALFAKPETDRIVRARAKEQIIMKPAPNRAHLKGEREGLAKLASKRERLAQRKLAQTKRPDAKRPDMRR